MRERPGEKDFPWWLVILAATGAVLFAQVIADELYSDVLETLMKGVGITVFVTLVAFSLATLLGLLVAMASMSRWIVARQAARLYVEIVRGVPILVLLLYVAFVVAPALVVAVNWVLTSLGGEGIRTRDFSLLWRAIIALTIGYSAFIAEVFRAGLLSVPEGQIEAAEALGLSPWQRFRLVRLPQALRVILPPLGNDFIAMIKDSSLVSVLGVTDITQLGKVTSAGNFRYFETYNVVALLYLVMTVTLSLALRRLEKRLGAGR
ncbi:amino acid ABC transporter permease [Vannielia litorea]|uniref:amino acid ABC transporter permease n=1 Tax=Vannielia litorea TaxID=1217970 RepID=UPI001C9763BF|nr:amino acid ABC transporter permease [Vannielia litorea]MBY6153457.1 amino acid ABC transporter permease [Vannielia litorea]